MGYVDKQIAAAQKRIADAVTERVVDALELIEIQ